MPKASASCGLAVHSNIFFAQYMRMKPCILPSSTICRCAAFHSASCVFACSSCSYEYTYSRLSLAWSSSDSLAQGNAQSNESYLVQYLSNCECVGAVSNAAVFPQHKRCGGERVR